MGLRDLFGGSSGPKWKCQSCGKIHKSNPSECKKCGHSVLIQER